MDGSARPTVHIENERVRVTEWKFATGDNTGWHRHTHDYVVVPLTQGKLQLLEPGGVRRNVDLEIGIPYFRETGVEHDVINANNFKFSFIEIEIKGFR
jgi:quercetin dioxygenase-like cupin family protein